MLGARLLGKRMGIVGMGRIGQAVAQQPHMYAALDALRTARSELQSALANKGGHREKALGLIDQAIGEFDGSIPRWPRNRFASARSCAAPIAATTLFLGVNGRSGASASPPHAPICPYCRALL